LTLQQRIEKELWEAYHYLRALPRVGNIVWTPSGYLQRIDEKPVWCYNGIEIQSSQESNPLIITLRNAEDTNGTATILPDNANIRVNHDGKAPTGISGIFNYNDKIYIFLGAPECFADCFIKYDPKTGETTAHYFKQKSLVEAYYATRDNLSRLCYLIKQQHGFELNAAIPEHINVEAIGGMVSTHNLGEIVCMFLADLGIGLEQRVPFFYRIGISMFRGISATLFTRRNERIEFPIKRIIDYNPSELYPEINYG